jgi:hypothetical protein
MDFGDETGFFQVDDVLSVPMAWLNFGTEAFNPDN